MFQALRPAFTLVVLMTLLTGLAYPLAVTGLAALAFPHQAGGSLVTRADGSVAGSTLIGQSFAAERYFHGRPSATTGPDSSNPAASMPLPYNASLSGGSNLGPTSRVLADRVAAEIAAVRTREGVRGAVPADLATASGSGLDPDISPDAARLQVARVARARNLSEARIRALVEAHIEGRLGGVIGEPRVNVLSLNMSLDQS
jgi:K+-transporting ATPase ATPase C chain